MAVLADYELSSYRGESLLSTNNAHCLYKNLHDTRCAVYTRIKYWGGYLNFGVWFRKIIFLIQKNKIIYKIQYLSFASTHVSAIYPGRLQGVTGLVAV